MHNIVSEITFSLYLVLSSLTLKGHLSGILSAVDALNEIRRTPHGISASGDALRRLLRSTVNFSTSASVVEALNFKIESKKFH